MIGFRYDGFGKRILDIAVAGAGLVVISPALAVVALAILVDDGAPIIFRQRRIGRHGVPFTLYKFRSMPTQSATVSSAEAQDLSITRVGTIIRRLSVDEIPQLVNVLRGEMSVVGPRPALPSQTELLELRTESGADRLRPGLTGLAQINSYDGMSITEKADFDHSYSRKVTCLEDLRLMTHTATYVLAPPPRY